MPLTARARVAGIMGWPVGHSLSPRLHGYWLREYGLDGAYIPFAVRPEDAVAALRMLPRLGFAGTNVTVPHKEIAFSLIDETDDFARRIGAANTLVCRPDGSLWGTSSDGFGFRQGLDQQIPDWNAGLDTVIVLGAGGASRAVCATLVDAGVTEIRLCNRTAHRAEMVAKAIGGPITVVPWERREAALRHAGLLVNTTNLGMTGCAPLEIALDKLPPEAIVCDIVYAPIHTPLLVAAAARGNRVVSGLEMLLHQARLGFSLWFGRDPEVTDGLRAHVRRALEG